ncbi:hypothetical protein [Flavobacterium poyangense]|jgi:hypothetical protein|uniref:hypothetical protein n=1 Tax=Flavobacterium poyangense TaxID=2204302 RepID=UPI00141DB31D|nr:hypothetical protein [Flavobacterium sp. JXAS1]
MKEVIHDNTIEILGLTRNQVLKIVLEWYTNGMYPDILQDEDGFDLEEIIEQQLY